MVQLIVSHSSCFEAPKMLKRCATFKHNPACPLLQSTWPRILASGRTRSIRPAKIRKFCWMQSARSIYKSRSETTAFDQSYFRGRLNTNNTCQQILLPNHRGVCRMLSCPFAAVWTTLSTEFGWWACRIPWKRSWRISTPFTGDIWSRKRVCCFSRDSTYSKRFLITLSNSSLDSEENVFWRPSGIHSSWCRRLSILPDMPSILAMYTRNPNASRSPWICSCVSSVTWSYNITGLNPPPCLSFLH